MKKTIKELWVKALRSRQYKQTYGQLNGGKNMRCCLGVLCDLYIKSSKGKAAHSKWREDDNDIVFISDNCLYGEEVVLPDEVIEWAGLYDNNPRLYKQNNEDNIYYQKSEANYLNDKKKLKFYQIAKLIEKNL